jgi:hypothetical protein
MTDELMSLMRIDAIKLCLSDWLKPGKELQCVEELAETARAAHEYKKLYDLVCQELAVSRKENRELRRWINMRVPDIDGEANE